MNYQVLARKWRPRNFQQMVGQEHILRALINALDNNRVHHAHLFTGTHGVGKTSLARILAKCLNCETGVTSTPCNTCPACQEIDQGRFIDLIEVDAASRTKVEDTRELLDNVQYPPSRGRFKIYIIDEVHMLSGHSFNALLKTLEEPPPYIIFLLATTDPQRLPATVLSRCLQFHLKNLAPELIAKHLQNILQQEKISFEEPALQHLARAADGSLRDALSLLDQAIAYGGGKIKEQDVSDMLGIVAQKGLWQLLNALVDQKPEAIMATIASLAEQGTDFEQALEALLSLLHRIALAQLVPEAVDNYESDQKDLLAITKRISKEDVQLYYQIALMGRRDLPLAPTLKSGFEMILLRMLAFCPASLDLTNSTATPPTLSQKKETTPTNTLKPSAPVELSTHKTASTHHWPELLSQLKLNGICQAIAEHCVLQEMTETQVKLLLNPNQAAMLNPKHEERIAAAFKQYLGKEIALKIMIGDKEMETPAVLQKNQQAARQQAALTSLEQDPNLRILLQTFDAKIQPEFIKPSE